MEVRICGSVRPLSKKTGNLLLNETQSAQFEQFYAPLSKKNNIILLNGIVLQKEMAVDRSSDSAGYHCFQVSYEKRCDKKLGFLVAPMSLYVQTESGTGAPCFGQFLSHHGVPKRISL